MKNLPLLRPDGNTPFDIARHGAAVGAARVNAGAILNELILGLEECNIAINEWADAEPSSDPGEEANMLAAEVIKERDRINTAIEEIARVMAVLFEAEA